MQGSTLSLLFETLGIVTFFFYCVSFVCGAFAVAEPARRVVLILAVIAAAIFLVVAWMGVFGHPAR